MDETNLLNLIRPWLDNICSITTKKTTAVLQKNLHPNAALVKHGAPANCHAHARGKANAFTPMDDGRATKLFHKRYDTLVMPRKLHSSSYRVTSVFSRRGQLYRLHHKTHRLHPHSLQYYGDVWLVAIPCHVTLTAVTSCLVFAYSLCPLYWVVLRSRDENGSDTDGYHWYRICFHIYVRIRIRIRIV
jgi:hypothetical protein